MYDFWNKRKQSKEQAKEVIQSLINDNLEAVNETVIEFLDEAIDGAQLLEDLIKLREKRNRLFAVREDLEDEIGWLSNAMAEVKDIEYPDGVPEESK